MTSLKFFFCLQIVALINITQSFVLLTANMEDVKKLARKFVSDSLADQITDFLTKIGNDTINVSEENEKNERYKEPVGYSYKNNLKNKKTQNFKRFKKHKKQLTETKYGKESNVDLSAYKLRSKLNNIAFANNNIKNNIDDKSDRDDVLLEKTTHSHLPKRTNEIPDMMLEENVPDEPPRDKPSQIAPQGFDSMNYEDKSETSDAPQPHSLLDRNSTKEFSLRYQGFNIDNNGYMNPTDSPRTYFEMKDRNKNVKTEFVATSGHVVLPKIEKQEWWEKDISTNEQSLEDLTKLTEKHEIWI